MQVISVEAMEKIVSKNRSLSWDGWNVIELIPNSKAMLKANGSKVRGVWYIKTTFIIEHDGWKIPSKYAE
jgi:hypothetical protein